MSDPLVIAGTFSKGLTISVGKILDPTRTLWLSAEQSERLWQELSVIRSKERATRTRPWAP